MADFLTTSGTSHQIENIIIEANSKLVLVSPYLKLSKTFHERLKDASERNVQIKIIYGKDELKPNERNSLAELKNVELYYFENLHAKCYFNESKMVITSMNMYEFSEKNNREMGVLIDRTNDKELFDKAVNETLSIIKSSEQEELKKTNRSFNKEVTTNSTAGQQVYQEVLRGYCIRCEERIDYNPSRPYCPECYSIWVQYENPFYEENVCHRCGEFESTSMEKPQCYTCYTVSDAKQIPNNYTSNLADTFNLLSSLSYKGQLTKANDYIFFKSILPSIDAIIKEQSITLKHTVKGIDEYNIKLINSKFQSKVQYHQLKLKKPTKDYSYYTWEIELPKANSTEVRSIIEDIRAIKF